MRISDWSSDVCSSDLFTHWNLPAYPHGGWFFNPFAWQFLFILGAWCAMRRHAAPWLQLLPRRPVTVLAVLYLLFSFLIVLTWLHQPWSVYIPRWLARVLYPIDKTEMDVWRLRRSEEHTSELQSLMRISYAVFR